MIQSSAVVRFLSFVTALSYLRMKLRHHPVPSTKQYGNAMIVVSRNSFTYPIQLVLLLYQSKQNFFGHTIQYAYIYLQRNYKEKYTTTQNTRVLVARTAELLHQYKRLSNCCAKIYISCIKKRYAQGEHKTHFFCFKRQTLASPEGKKNYTTCLP